MGKFSQSARKELPEHPLVKVEMRQDDPEVREVIRHSNIFCKANVLATSLGTPVAARLFGGAKRGRFASGSSISNGTRTP
jgi:hypothetical protein